MFNYEEVVEFACYAHRDQIRKYTGEPYINHCFDIVEILKEYGIDSKFAHSVAMLHDTVEDTEVTFTEIEKRFGKDIMLHVFFLTDVSRLEFGNRNLRKTLDRFHVATCPWMMVQLIKCADMISNAKSIVKYDYGFSLIYLKEMKLLLENMLEFHPHILHEKIYKKALEYVDNNNKI